MNFNIIADICVYDIITQGGNCTGTYSLTFERVQIYEQGCQKRRTFL